MAESTDQTDARDIRQIERGEVFKRFVAGEGVPGFFADFFLPYLTQHYTRWLDQVKTKQAAPEVLIVLDQLMAGMTETIKLGEMAHERMIKRRFGPAMKGA